MLHKYEGTGKYKKNPFNMGRTRRESFINEQ